MASLHRTLFNETKKLPRRLLVKFVSEKLSESGNDKNLRLAEAIADHILAGKDEPFLWSDGSSSSTEPSNLTISFTQADTDVLSSELSRIAKEVVPQAIAEILEEIPHDILKRMQRDWPEWATYQESLLADFRNNLYDRWGKGLDLLKMLYGAASDLGEESVKRLRRSRAKKKMTLNPLLVRLHARACQVTAEIIVLLENGFADGAMARWRTLYEISVVARVVADGGEEVAVRYIDHAVIETKSEMETYAGCCDVLGYEPVSARERKRIIREHQEATNKYGSAFGTQYGWAAKHLGIKRPTFKDLEQAAAKSHMRSHYKFACQNVHAGSKALFFRLSALGDRVPLIAGASNAGLDEPGQNTAITLMQITFTLNEHRMPNLDVMVRMKTMMRLADLTSQAFYKAGKRLERDEKRIAASRDI